MAVPDTAAAATTCGYAARDGQRRDRLRRADALRAPRRGLADVPATELGAIAIRAGLERAGVAPDEVGYVVMGQVLQAGAGQAPARQAAVGAGIPKEVPADTINKVCASSVRALEIAELMVEAGRHEVVVTGGMESMSRAPYLLPRARFGYRMGNGEILDHMVFDGLTSTFDGLHMIQQASVSRDLQISRETRTRGRPLAQARRQPRMPAASTTRSSPSATSPRTRASAATRRSRSSR